MTVFVHLIVIICFKLVCRSLRPNRDLKVKICLISILFFVTIEIPDEDPKSLDSG